LAGGTSGVWPKAATGRARTAGGRFNGIGSLSVKVSAAARRSETI
jgi:hypothetical protein